MGGMNDCWAVFVTKEWGKNIEGRQWSVPLTKDEATERLAEVRRMEKEQRKEHDMDLKERIREAINCTSADNSSDTPDFILAEYLLDCLAAFDKANTARTKYFAPTPTGKPCICPSPNVKADPLSPEK